MRGRPAIAFLLPVLAASLGMFPIKTAAQCFGALPLLGQISGMTGNPFQAEVKETFLSQNTSLLQSMEPRTQRVARDSQGRLHTEWSTGKYKVQNGPDAGAEEEQRHITICDPVKGESISLDTLNKTATVQKVNFASMRTITPPAAVPLQSFCSRQFLVPPTFPNTEVENLGQRAIEGLEAQGQLQKRTVQLRGGPSGDATAATREMVNLIETWCSEDLGAIILRVIGTEKKGSSQTVAMVNIQRGEPDETLFQIPSGYRIVERVNDPAVRTGVGVIGGISMSSPAGQIVVPDKP
jgi:hypothetical protein